MAESASVEAVTDIPVGPAVTPAPGGLSVDSDTVPSQDLSSDDDVVTSKGVRNRKRRLVSSDDETPGEESAKDEGRVAPDPVPVKSPRPLKPVKSTRPTAKASTSSASGGGGGGGDGSTNQLDYIFKGPKKSGDILCWLEGEFLRRNIPRAYR